jgi:integrase
VNRLLNDLRAALNACAEAHRRELPPHLPAEISIGTRAEQLTGQARKQLLPDVMVRAAIEAAFELDDDGCFGRLVLLAAATGARYSQLAALTVGSVQPASGRIIMPGSKKGRAAQARPAVAVPLSEDVLERLAPAVDGREATDPLLTRWAFRRISAFRWEKLEKRPLGAASEVDSQWAAVVQRAQLPPGTIMYAFRHSSIVRGLRQGLPVRLVASLHDTSTEMIEKHYSAFIVDMTEELARRAVLSLV